MFKLSVVSALWIQGYALAVSIISSIYLWFVLSHVPEWKVGSFYLSHVRPLSNSLGHVSFFSHL